MVYEWKQGARYSADANIIARELDTIGEAITPDDIIKVAKNKKSELYKCFTWDDIAAAHLYRKEEARTIMQTLIIVPDNEELMPIIRAYENITINENKAYVQIKTILMNEEWKADLFAEIRKTIEYSIHKIDSLETICGDNHTMKNVKNRLVAASELI